MTLEDFIEDEKARLDLFAVDWQELHGGSAVDYPMHMNPDSWDAWLMEHRERIERLRWCLLNGLK